jgi:hypothetical protein
VTCACAMCRSAWRDGLTRVPRSLARATIPRACHDPSRVERSTSICEVYRFGSKSPATAYAHIREHRAQTRRCTRLRLQMQQARSETHAHRTHALFRVMRPTVAQERAVTATAHSKRHVSRADDCSNYSSNSSRFGAICTQLRPRAHRRSFATHAATNFAPTSNINNKIYKYLILDRFGGETRGEGRGGDACAKSIASVM